MNKNLPKIVIYIIKFCYKKLGWKLLKLLPSNFPDSPSLELWSSSPWPDYQCWLDKYSQTHLKQLWTLREQSKTWKNAPSFSIIIPVYNTPVAILTETIHSVRQQSYPYWQLCIADDGSNDQTTLNLLKSSVTQDPRIDITHNDTRHGISEASNKALTLAKGDYIVFLDHDDRITHDALHCLAVEIRKNSHLDIIYSDRDMIAPEGFRYMHLMKPDWSPETLLSGNYIFHLMCYRHKFLKKLGYLRKEFDGSQDYDLILRAAEQQPTVCHIPKVLYSWRQQTTSIANNPETKQYVFEAGKAALKDALSRRGIKGNVYEDTALWRGNYYINFLGLRKDKIHILEYQPGTPSEELAQRIDLLRPSIYLILLCSGVNPENKQSVKKLAAPLMLNNVGITTGKILTNEEDQKLFHAGLFFTAEGRIFPPYRGFPTSEPGYMAITSTMRNVSLPHPMCLAIKKDLYKQLNGLQSNYSIEVAILDLALRAREKNWNFVYEPKALFSTENNLNDSTAEFGTALEYSVFRQRLQDTYPNGDPYYNPNLSTKRNDMSLKCTEL